MRDIKFRGKHKNPYGDKWVYGYYALEDGEHVIVMPHSTSYEEALKEKKTNTTYISKTYGRLQYNRAIHKTKR